MTIKYLDYPNSESIFGISEMEFLSYEEKNKLIPQKLSDLNLKNLMNGIKDELSKIDMNSWKLFKQNDIV